MFCSGKCRATQGAWAGHWVQPPCQEVTVHHRARLSPSQPAACRSPVMGWKALGEAVIKSQKIANSPAAEGRGELGPAGVSRQG